MRRFVSLLAVLAVGLLTGLTACESAPSSWHGSPTPWTRLTAGADLQCGTRSIAEPISHQRPDEQSWSIDHSTFVCRFGTGECVLWVSSIGGRQEYWVIAAGPARQTLVQLLGMRLDWPPALVASLRDATTGGRLGDAEWYIGFDGALVVDIDDSSPVM